MVGMTLSKRLHYRVFLLGKIKLMIQDISIMMRYQALTVKEILFCLCENSAYEKLTFLSEINKIKNVPFQLAWENSVADWQEKAIYPEDRALITEIGTSLGECDIEGQLSILCQKNEKLEIILKNAVLECSRKGKLYRSLGVLTGVFISIMML